MERDLSQYPFVDVPDQSIPGVHQGAELPRQQSTLWLARRQGRGPARRRGQRLGVAFDGEQGQGAEVDLVADEGRQIDAYRAFPEVVGRDSGDRLERREGQLRGDDPRRRFGQEHAAPPGRHHAGPGPQVGTAHTFAGFTQRPQPYVVLVDRSVQDGLPGLGTRGVDPVCQTRVEVVGEVQHEVVRGNKARQLRALRARFAQADGPYAHAGIALPGRRQYGLQGCFEAGRGRFAARKSRRHPAVAELDQGPHQPFEDEARPHAQHRGVPERLVARRRGVTEVLDERQLTRVVPHFAVRQPMRAVHARIAYEAGFREALQQPADLLGHGGRQTGHQLGHVRAAVEMGGDPAHQFVGRLAPDGQRRGVAQQERAVVVRDPQGVGAQLGP